MQETFVSRRNATIPRKNVTACTLLSSVEVGNLYATILLADILQNKAFLSVISIGMRRTVADSVNAGPTK